MGQQRRGAPSNRSKLWGLPIFEDRLIKSIQYFLRKGFQGDNNIRDTLRSNVVWHHVERIESRMYPHTWWQCEFEGVVTHLTGDLVRTSTLESKNTGCGKLCTLLRGHLDQGPITYVERMALAMLVSLCDSLALEVIQNGSGRYPFTPHAVKKLLHVLRTCIYWGIQIV